MCEFCGICGQCCVCGTQQIKPSTRQVIAGLRDTRSQWDSRASRAAFLRQIGPDGRAEIRRLYTAGN